MLEKEGHTVLTAHDGDKCLKIYKQHKLTNQFFDIIIFGLTIPGGKGSKEMIKELLK